jgi:HEAT repeat protein
MASVFISYNRESEVIAKTLAKDIQELGGHKVWYDHKLSGGQEWWNQILAEIRANDVFALIMTPGSLSSTACMRECRYAIDLGKPILPVLASEEVSLNRLPSMLSEIQIIEYKEHGVETIFGLSKALNSLPPPKSLPEPLPDEPDAPISHLGSLARRLETTATLNYQEQTALMVDLQKTLRDSDTADDARALLEQMRNRRDLFATIAEEIDQLLKSSQKATSLPPPKESSEKDFSEGGGSSRKIDLALSRLKDADPLNRIAAVKVLGQHASLSVSEAIFSMIEDTDIGVLDGVHQVILKSGDKLDHNKVLAYLEDKIQNPEHYNLADIALAIGRLGETKGVDTLMGLLGHANPDLRCAAALGLGESGDPVAIEWLLERLSDPDVSVCQACAEALLQIEDPQAVRKLMNRFESAFEDTNFRRAIVSALKKYCSDDAIQAILTRLEKTDPPINEEYLLILGSLHNSAAIGEIMKLPTDIRFKAIDIFQHEPDSRVFSNFLPFLKDEDWVIRDKASNALGEIGGTDTVDAIMPLLESKDWAPREAAIKILGYIGGKQTIDRILQLLSNTDTDTQKYAIRVLGDIGGNEVVTPLLKLLSNKDLGVRKSAVDALGKVKSAKAFANIAALINDKNSSLRESAARALGNIGGEAAVEPLLLALKDTVAGVRSAAAEALGKIDDPKVLGVLKPLLDDPNKEVRKAALGGLLQHVVEDEIFRDLLSVEFDGYSPWIDPQKPIDDKRVAKGAEYLELTESEIRQKYQLLNDQLNGTLTLTWIENQ